MNCVLIPHLSFDIFADEILPRLPVKSLMKFTSVCKKWRELIKSRQFIQAHLHHNRFESKGKLEYPLIYNRSSLYALDQNHKPVLFAKLDIHPEPTSAYYIYSCNGMVLVHVYGYRWSAVYLWNPSIRRIKEIFSVVTDKHNWQEFYGLGFHETSKEHRVVKITRGDDEDSSAITTVEVYSCSLDSWRKVDPMPSEIINPGEGGGGVYLNGCIHWLVLSSDYVYSITLFDFENETFREMAIPEEVKKEDTYVADLKEFQGSLAVVYFTSNANDYRLVWNMILMTEYGVFESWTKKFSDNLPEEIQCYATFFDSFTKNGVLVYEEFCCVRCLKFIDVQNRQSNFIGGFNDQNIVIDYENWRSKFFKGFEEKKLVIDYMESLTLLC